MIKGENERHEFTFDDEMSYTLYEYPRQLIIDFILIGNGLYSLENYNIKYVMEIKRNMIKLFILSVEK